MHQASRANLHFPAHNLNLNGFIAHATRRVVEVGDPKSAPGKDGGASPMGHHDLRLDIYRSPVYRNKNENEFAAPAYSLLHKTDAVPMLVI